MRVDNGQATVSLGSSGVQRKLELCGSPSYCDSFS